jgi:hypothetical protein
LLIGIIAFFGILIVVLSVIGLVRISSVNLSDTSRVPAQPLLRAYPGEKVSDAVYGIMNTHMHGGSFLGAGKLKNTENTMLMTGKRFIFVEVPMPGGDNAVGTTIYPIANTFFNRGEMRAEGEALVRGKDLDDVLEVCPVAFGVQLSDIREITLSSSSFKLIANDGSVYSYVYVYDPEQKNLLKGIFEKTGAKLTVNG